MILEGNKDKLVESELETLLEVERQARQNNELELSLKTAKEILNLLWDSKDLDLLGSTVKKLCLKRGQPIKTITHMVRSCMGYLNEIENVGDRMKLTEDLKAITEKKIFLEVEYARCCMMIVKHNESNLSNLKEAVKIMENVQVETYGSMSKQEKLEFILYQMKLNFMLEDFTKLIIVSRKVNHEHLEEEGFEYLKVGYFLYNYHYYKHETDFESCTDSLEKVFEALNKCKNTEKLLERLDVSTIQNFGGFLDKTNLAEAILSCKCLSNFKTDKFEEIENLTKTYEVYFLSNNNFTNLIDSFRSKEISSCNMSLYFQNTLFFFNSSFDQDGNLFKTLEKQLIKKNLYIVSLYYKNIRMEKLEVLLENKIDFIEDLLCELILDNFVHAKINRLTRIVDFIPANAESDVIDDWVKNINEIVDLVDFVCERIEREEVNAL
jgi:26S proteasome regulatory subunit N5